jgi:hypothetical protein
VKILSSEIHGSLVNVPKHLSPATQVKHPQERVVHLLTLENNLSIVKNCRLLPGDLLFYSGSPAIKGIEVETVNP